MFLKRSSVVSNDNVEGGDGTGGNVPLKTVDERRLEKLEKKAAKQRKEEEKEKLDQIEYLKFPNIMV